MDHAKSPQVVVASDILKYQTWFLKVPIHCEGCRRKVKKVLQRIDGVFTTTIDLQQQKVTVTGSVGVDTLIGKLTKAESVENHSATDNKSEPNLNSDKSNGLVQTAANCDIKIKTSEAKKSATNNNMTPPAAVHHGGEIGGGGGTNKKKKKKGGGGGSGSTYTPAPVHTESHSHSTHDDGQVNLSPTRQQSYPYPYPHPMVYLTTYNRLSPMGRVGGPSSYYVPSSPYTHAGLDQEIYQMQSAPLVSFEIFSDENANGCSIM
ncbi:heavy metal-associated isoprenylated plant protein 35-like [Senna tora]|uniref:Heavy metal-associated isoprenylated plant protein 35-like n=1 Tax=Senna tora TaxID=362788 RepID=A0A834WXM7_9FABA|nr:heavy metal-associated isoprenylated plant protein 35-like [Senna tora]